MGLAWRIYADENNDTFMTGTSVTWARGAWVLSFTNSINPSLLLCPGAVNWRGPDNYSGSVTAAYGFPINNPVNPANPLIASYGVNCWIYNPNTNNVQGRDATLHWRKYGNATQQSVTPLFADSMWRGGGPSENDPPPDYNGQWPWNTNSFGEMGFFAMKRHGRGINILFFDGSARNTPVKNLWQLPWHQNWNTTNETGVFPAWMD